MQGLNCTANLFDQFRRELHGLHDMFDHAALAARIGIGDHPVWRTGNVFGFGLVAILQQGLLVACEINARATVQRLCRFCKCVVIQ